MGHTPYPDPDRAVRQLYRSHMPRYYAGLLVERPPAGFGHITPAHIIGADLAQHLAAPPPENEELAKAMHAFRELSAAMVRVMSAGRTAFTLHTAPERLEPPDAPPHQP